MSKLSDTRVAIIAMDGFEESELTEPMRALKDAGARIDVISKKSGRIQAFKHHDKASTVVVDKTLEECRPDQYDALMLPGGALNADQARMEPKVREFIRSFMGAGKPMAVICHAPWELISAGVARGRRLTSYYTIQDDLKNAGANWVDQEVVFDGSLVTSRQPSDLPAFNREMLEVFSRVHA
jgi:protease I